MDDLRSIRLEQSKAIELLTTTLPPDTGDFFIGFDCLVAMVRNVYAIRAYQTDLATAMNEFKGYEEANPLLKFAWGSFGPSNSNRLTRERCAEEKTKAMQALVGTPTTENTNFTSLMHSPKMRETFLAHETFRLLESVTKISGSEQTRTHPRPMEMLLWRNKDTRDTLQKAVDDHFESRHSPDRSEHTFLIANPPALVRVAFSPRQSWPLCREDVMQFYMPVGKFVWVDNNTAVEYHPRNRIKRYGLIVAVKITPRHPEKALVISWNHLTQTNRVTTQSSVATSPCDFGDKHDGQYLLVYAQITNDNLPFDLAIAMLSAPKIPRVLSPLEKRCQALLDRVRQERIDKASSSAAAPAPAVDRPFFDEPALAPNDDDYISQTPPSTQQPFTRD